MILMIDNYDSFTWNLVQMLSSFDRVEVVRNYGPNVDDLKAMAPDRLVISPGPGMPSEAGISKDAIAAFAGKIPVLGVCLGHQAMAEVFGGSVVRADIPCHGKVSPVFHREEGIFERLPSPFGATRYHSLVVEERTLPPEMRVTARIGDGTIMAMEHERHSLYGVQFHPEAVLTEAGRLLLKNFCGLTSGKNERRWDRYVESCA